MTIAINSPYFLKPAGTDFFYDYLVQIAVANPEHQFIFITPSLMDEELISSKNITHVSSSPRGDNPLMWKIWLDYTLPGIARKYRVDVLLHTAGVCSLRTRVPQHIFISDLSFLSFPHFFLKKQLHFIKKNMHAFLHKAISIVTASDFLSKEIIQQYAVAGKKINMLQPGTDELYQPSTQEKKESIKERYAEGKEYFLCSGEIHPRFNLVNLLKAFSFFKKRQKSNMQLIITCKAVAAGDSFMENFKMYKYRKEVSLLMDLPQKDLPGITAAAYAFVYPVLYDGTAIPALQAMQCEVPVITSKTGPLKEINGDAALYADPANFEDIADKMMILFKDETRRRELIKKGKLYVQKNNKEKMEDQWWRSIVNPVA